ncbi:hypothetical protein GCM10027425_04850 [Alteromonas gracilis]
MPRITGGSADVMASSNSANAPSGRGRHQVRSRIRDSVPEAPVVATEAPVVATEAPLVATEAPLMAAEAPAMATEAPLVAA